MPSGVIKGHAHTAPPSPRKDSLRRAIQRFENERRQHNLQTQPKQKQQQQINGTNGSELSLPTATAPASASSSSCSVAFTDVRKSIAEQEEQRGIISMHVCWNDFSPSQHRQKVRWFFDVQQLFSIQLPKMPREYITRLVFDRSHRSLMVHKHGFAEIVFCAVTADEQVKGYGTHMMNHLKDFMIAQLGIFHLLTYADEFAIGYFAKQDFVTQIGLPEDRYKGFIKEYQGATLMYCQLHPKMVYVHSKQIYQDMRSVYMLALRERFPNFGREFDGLEAQFRLNEGRPLRAEQIPGLETLHNFEELRKTDMAPQADVQQTIRAVLQKLRADKNAWPFQEPVDADEVPDYYEYIPFPVDLGTIAEQLKSGYYTHERMFVADIRRMFDNCYKFNAPDSQYYFHAFKLNELFVRLARQHFAHCKLQVPLPTAKPEYVPSSGGGRK
uniref:histone acetyltransferase n=1 Tax=Globodera rostochiensis TaxID=31243 RepID=A0A914I7P2_GLORO